VNDTHRRRKEGRAKTGEQSNKKKNDPVKEDRRVSKGKTETERGKHWPANARALALPPSIPAPPALPLWITDQKRNTSEQTQTKKKKNRGPKPVEREDKPEQKKKATEYKEFEKKKTKGRIRGIVQSAPSPAQVNFFSFPIITIDIVYISEQSSYKSEQLVWRQRKFNHRLKLVKKQYFIASKKSWSYRI